jgi:diguanylate cyclase (GGDEF)-like protein
LEQPKRNRALKFLTRLRSAAAALLVEPVPSSNRVRRVARDVVQTSAVLVMLLLFVLLLGPGFSALGEGASDPRRLLALVALGTVYGLLYVAASRIHKQYLAAWSSAALVVVELCLLITLIPIFALYLGPLLPADAVKRLTASGSMVFELAFVFGILVFAMRGWGRYAARSAHARAAAESAAFYERLANQDALTGLPNRRKFESALTDALSPGRPPDIAVLMIDVDKFKRINDDYSHDVGDEVLKGIGRILQSVVGTHGLPARLAGDEFVVLCAGLNPQRVSELARRLQTEVRSHDWQRLAPGLAVSISVGEAMASAGDSVSTILRRSDSRMYESKRSAQPARAQSASLQP